jgi:hypothetical protein
MCSFWNMFAKQQTTSARHNSCHLFSYKTKPRHTMNDHVYLQSLELIIKKDCKTVKIFKLLCSFKRIPQRRRESAGYDPNDTSTRYLHPGHNDTHSYLYQKLRRQERSETSAICSSVSSQHSPHPTFHTVQNNKLVCCIMADSAREKHAASIKE